MDQQFVIASDALRAAVEELRSMNLIKDDVPHDVAYRYPDRYYGINQEQVVQTVPEDVAAFEPEVVMNNVARAVQAIEKAESLVASPTEDLRRRVEVYRQTVKMFKNAGKAYRAMHASMMLFWDGLEQYQAGNYDTAYSTLRKARNAISGHESENINIPDPNPFVGQFYDAMDTLTTSDLPDGYNQNDKFIWELHWTIQASSALTTVTSELGRIFGGLEGIANMLHRYAEMKRAYAKDDWDDIQFHVRSFDGRPDTIKGTFAKDPQLRTPNVFDAYDPPGLCIGKNTEEPVAELNRAASEQHDDALEDAMRAFETAIQNCPSFPDPPANR